MGHHRSRFAVAALAALLVGTLVLADQGSPVYQATGTKPTAGGACVGDRVQIEFDTGKLWCCGATVAGQWGTCGVSKNATTADVATKLAADPGLNGLVTRDCGVDEYVTGINEFGQVVCSTAVAVSGHADTADLATTASALSADPTACAANQYVRDTAANGTLTCAQPAYSGLSGLPTLAPLGASYVVGAADATLTAERVATDTATIDVDIGTAGQMKWNVITPVATATALAADPTDCTGSNFAKGVNASGTASCAQPAFTDLSGTATMAQFPIGSSGNVLIGGGGGASSYTNRLVLAIDVATLSLPLDLASPSVATSGATMVDSHPITFAGAYWNGSASVPVESSISMNVADTNGKSYVEFKFAGVTKASISSTGVIAGDGTGLSGVQKAADPATSLGTCSGLNRGQVQIKEGAGAPDQAYVCLRNSDGVTFGWAMFGLAVQ